MQSGKLLSTLPHLFFSQVGEKHRISCLSITFFEFLNHLERPYDCSWVTPTQEFWSCWPQRWVLVFLIIKKLWHDPTVRLFCGRIRLYITGQNTPVCCKRWPDFWGCEYTSCHDKRLYRDGEALKNCEMKSRKCREGCFSLLVLKWQHPRAHGQLLLKWGDVSKAACDVAAVWWPFQKKVNSSIVVALATDAPWISADNFFSLLFQKVILKKKKLSPFYFAIQSFPVNPFQERRWEPKGLDNFSWNKNLQHGRGVCEPAVLSWRNGLSVPLQNSSSLLGSPSAIPVSWLWHKLGDRIPPPPLQLLQLSDLSGNWVKLECWGGGHWRERGGNRTLL